MQSNDADGTGSKRDQYDDKKLCFSAVSAVIFVIDFVMRSKAHPPGNSHESDDFAHKLLKLKEEIASSASSEN